MTSSEYMEHALKLLDDGKISEEVYDQMMLNIDVFTYDEEEEEDEEDDKVPEVL